MKDNMKDSMNDKRSGSPRFFVDSLSGGRVSLCAAEAHHAGGVLRLAVGAKVTLFDGCGGLGEGRIAEIKKGQVAVEIVRLLDRQIREAPAVHLAFAVPKGKRLDWLLEKATELAAASLQPVVCRRSVAGADKLNERQLGRWRGHCISAAKQCGLNLLPEIRQPLGLEAYVRSIRETPAGVCLFGDTGETAISLGEALGDADGGGEVFLLVGPEGGLDDDEKRTVAEAGCRAVRIGTTTLRVETAAIALLAAVRALTTRPR